MNIKRWLPFLLLLSILGGGVFWLTIDKGEGQKPVSTLKTSATLTRMFNAIDSVELYPSNAFESVEALLDSVQKSNLDPIEKDQLTEKLGKKAVELFDQRFNAWVGSGFGSVPPELEYTELRNMVDQLGLKYAGIGNLQREFPKYAQAVVLYKLYFQPGDPNELNARLNRMRNGKYDLQLYQDLLTVFNSHTDLLDGFEPVRRAQSQIEWQRQCHELVEQHWRSLKDSSVINTDYYNKHELNPSVIVQKSFLCGVRTYDISDFRYYYKRGRDLDFWKQAIW